MKPLEPKRTRFQIAVEAWDGPKPQLVEPRCTCPAGSYNPGNVHEPYCKLAVR